MTKLKRIKQGPFEEKESKTLKEISEKDIIPIEKRAIHIPDNVKSKIVGYEDYGLLCLGMDTIALIEYHKEIGGVRF